MKAEEKIWTVGVSQEFPGSGEHCCCIYYCRWDLCWVKSQADREKGSKAKSHVSKSTFMPGFLLAFAPRYFTSLSFTGRDPQSHIE